MAKLLTNREMELFRRIVVLAELLDRANPEVGMGPSRLMLAKDQADTLSFEIDIDDIEEAAEEISGS
jgi:hypothetical protein